jgi:hypothetical protein
MVVRELKFLLRLVTLEVLRASITIRLLVTYCQSLFSMQLLVVREKYRYSTTKSNQKKKL